VTVSHTQFIHSQSALLSPTRVNGKIIDGFLLLDHHPQVVVSGNNVYVVWVSHYPGNDDVYFTGSSNGGISFGKIVDLDRNPGDSYEPHIALAGNNVYVIWVDETPGPYGNPDILFRRSTNGGTTFGPTLNLSNNPGISSEPEMAVSGNNVYVVWRDNTPGTEEILFKRSINGGGTFGTTVNISNEPSSLSTLQRISALNHNVYVVWAEGPFNNRQILFKRSVDGGATFGNTTFITNSSTGDSFNPQVSAANNNVYLLWERDLGNASKQLFFKRSIDAGASFGNTTNVGGSSKEDSTNGLLNSSGNNVYVTWTDNSTGHSQILFKRSVDGGATFGSTLSQSNAIGQSQHPDIAVFNNSVYGAWQDRILGHIGIFFKKIM
jgi:hypothetical protein